MGISKEEAIKELQTREEIFVAYSQATKLPYVKCDEETFNDQAWIFSTEEGIKEFGKKMLEEKVLLMGMKFTKKDYPRLYGTFYAIGVNTVVWVDGEDKIEIDLPDIAKQADMSKIEPAKRPLLNPTLELSGIYFMQELRRPVEKDQHGNLRELEEELIVNLKKSEYLVAMNVDPEDPKKINIPYLKNKKEEILQPVFTDVMELEKFTKGQKLRIAKVPFAKLPELLIDKAMAYAVNPLGFNLVLNREQLNKIIGDQIVLTVGYDIENLNNTDRKKKYHGEVTIDRYGRRIPKHAHGTTNLKRQTSSTKMITDAVIELYDRIVDRNLLIRRINITANRLVDESSVKKEEVYEQLDLFTDYEAQRKKQEEEEAALNREKRMQEAMLSIKKKFGKNAVLKGMNLQEGATARDRNEQIGGHKA